MFIIRAAARIQADWWSAMDKETQELYLKKHPNSSKNKLKTQEGPKPTHKESTTPLPKAAKGKAAHKAASVDLDSNQVDAIKEYTGNMYLTVNPKLRAGKPVSKADAKELKLIDDAFAKAKTTEDIEVYRGISGDAMKHYQHLKPGDSFKDSAFVSTSTDKDTADNFSRGDGKAIMQVRVPKGSKAISVDSLSVFKKGGNVTRSENEILLDRNSSFKVVSIKPGKHGGPATIIVEMQN